jgi:hypothetical protein
VKAASGESGDGACLMSDDLKSVKLAFFPAFGPEDAAEFTDQFHRAKFYLKPVVDRVRELAFVREASMTPGPLPSYLDPIISKIAWQFDDSVRLANPDEGERIWAEAEYILHWNTAIPLPPELAQKKLRNVDRRRFLEECQDWLTLSSQVGGAYHWRVDESKQRYRDVVAKHRARRCYIFGTGPNLSLAANHDYSQGVSVVCNSMVKNEKLLDRMKPPLIVAADPIFHAGASVYAADFRNALYSAMERYGSYYLCNQRDFRIFDSYMPDGLRHRLIGAPAGWGMNLRTDTTENFDFTACPNILTLFLLPIAVAMSEKEIYIAGCDGRPLRQNSYFWAHDKSVQFNDKMTAIQEAHPSFFDISYDDYYFLHCETVSSWIGTAQSVGRTVVNMTPSYIPALRKVFSRPADVEKGEPAEEWISPWTRLRMRKVFLDRQWTAFRHSVWPRWKRRIRSRLSAAEADA